MNPPRTELPADFLDRHSRLKRAWFTLQILLRRRTVKVVCCESFRKEKGACKGCATLYNVNSPSWLYRLAGRWAKRRES